MNYKNLYETIMNNLEKKDYTNHLGSIERFRRSGAKWIIRQVLLPPIPDGTDKKLPDYFDNFNYYGKKAIESAVFIRDNHKCQLCGGRAEQVRDIRPSYLGGSAHPRNRISVCSECNREVAELLRDNMILAIKRTFKLYNLEDRQMELNDFE